MQNLPKRTVGRSGVSVFPLGFGCMRLPALADHSGPDIERSVKLLCDAFDKGVTYFDTAFGYLGGKSEVIVGQALKNLPRGDVTVATKLPIWNECSVEHAEHVLATQLERLGTDYIDFYLLHGQSRKVFARAKEAKILEWLDQKVRQGVIRYPSFSFHDDYDCFKEIIDAYDWFMAQIQINLIDINHQATMAGVEYAGKKGVSIIAMEPLLGGSLAQNVPEEVVAEYGAYPERRSPVEWAFRFLMDRPEISVILSGMSDEAQRDDNIAIFKKDHAPGCFSKEDHALIARIRSLYEGRRRIGCTNCRYCMPCPQNVNIPGTFERLNEGYRYNKIPDALRGFYAEAQKKNEDAARCVACGACEKVCPQHLPIIDTLAEVAEMMK